MILLLSRSLKPFSTEHEACSIANHERSTRISVKSVEAAEKAYSSSYGADRSNTRLKVLTKRKLPPQGMSSNWSYRSRWLDRCSCCSADKYVRGLAISRRMCVRFSKSRKRDHRKRRGASYSRKAKQQLRFRPKSITGRPVVC